MNHPGYPQDEAIERVLVGLRHAEAPAGMEARILRTLETRTAAQSSWLASLRGWLLHPAACLAGAAALASALALVFFIHLTKHTDAIPVHNPQVASALTPPSSKASGTPPQQTALSSGTSPRLRTVAPPQAPQPPSSEDALALSEMLAPSKPAPPLPLTHEEKMLARVVNYGDPEVLAELKPEVRARQVELAKAEFHDFFEPPPPAKGSE